MGSVALAGRLVLAAVFSIAGAGKLTDLGGSRSALEGFGAPRRVAVVGGVLLPAAELVVAVGLLVPATARWSAFGAIGLLMVFVAAIGLNLARGRKPDCHCFGQVHSAPAGWGTLLRNTGLAGLAGVVLAAGKGEMLSPVGWVGELSTAEVVLAAVAVVLAGVAVAQGWFLLELFHQNGRILARLEDLEAQPGSGLASGAMRAAHAGNGDGNGRVAGLAVGALAPGFELPALDGERVSLEGLRSRGLPVLLLFSDPGCGPCNALLPDVDQWQRDHSERLTVALISRGSVEQNTAKASEHELSDVLLQEDREAATAFQAHGTPAAVLVTVDGKIASPLATGPQAISALVQDVTTVSPLQVMAPFGEGGRASPQMPAGLEVGAEVPALEWEDLDGRLISLRELSGTLVTLLFWNPNCRFCQYVAPELRAWQESHNDDEHRVIAFSSGTAAENRALGLGLPIVLEQGFNTGSIFGVRGTPSAVAIDSDCRAAAAPAVGGPAVLQLLAVQANSWASA
ncbi:MAG: MauE/DoxX family redox-associated membrane protein [Solirubrobacteraceae bacterium]